MKNFFKLSAVILLFVSLQSCDKEPTLLDKTAVEIKAYTKATDVQLVTKGIEGFVHNKGEYILNITASDLIDKENRAGSLLTSMCAKMIFDKLPAEEQQKDRKVHAIIKSKGKTAHYYNSFKDLRGVAPFMDFSTKALETIKAKKYEEAYVFFNHQIIDKEAYDRYVIAPIVNEHGDIFFGTKQIETVGFRYADFKGKNTIVIYHRFVHNGKDLNFKTTHYKRQEPSIIGIAFI